MISKSLKFWHNWLHRNEERSDMTAEDTAAVERRHPATITVRAVMRQKQKMNKTATQ